MRFTKIKNLSAWKETIFSSLAIALFLAVYYIFPSFYGQGLLPIFQTITKSALLLVVAPWLFVRFILQKDFRDFGFNLKNKKIGFISAGIALVFSLILSYILISYAGFLKIYQLQPIVIASFWFFLLKELVLINILLFIQLSFFQGFVLSVFSKKFLYGSIFIQAMLFLLPNLLSQSHPLSYLPMIVIALLGGTLSYINRSFFYSYFYGLAYIILLDSYVIYALKTGL